MNSIDLGQKQVSDFCEHGNGNVGFHKKRGIY
jgi:hypothetical protein